MNIKSWLVTCFLVFLVALVKGQNTIVEAKIIAKSGDTLVGKIKNYPKNGWEHEPKTISFVAASGKETVYAPRDINGFVIGQSAKFYQSATVELNNEPIREDKLKVLSSVNDINKFQLDKTELFLLVLTKGSLNLYEYYDVKDKYHYFINTNSEPIKELIYRRVIVDGTEGQKIYTVDAYKKQLSEATLKCNKNKSLSYLKCNKNELLKIVTDYNECLGKTIFVAPEQESNSYGILYLGLSSPFLSVELPNSAGEKHFVGYFKPVIGLGSTWSLTRNGSQLKVGFDAFFWRHKFISARDNTSKSNETVEAVYTSTGMKLNLSLVYAMNNDWLKSKKIKTYLRGGTGSSFFFGSDFKLNFYESSASTGSRPYYPKKVEYFSFLAGVGAVRNNWLAELRFERGRQPSSLLSLKTSYVTLYFGRTFR